MSFDVKARTRAGELRYGEGKHLRWIAVFAFLIANMVVCAAYAQAPPPGSTLQKSPAGGPPEAQAPLPGAAIQKGPAGSPPDSKATPPGAAIPIGPAGNPPGAQAPPPGAANPKGPAGSPPEAKVPLPGAANQKGPAADVDGITTAIDVADLLNRGVSNAEISTLLSNQKGFDRTSALKKGQTDEQIIKNLITTTKNLPPVEGVDRAKQHEDEGDKQFRASNYSKAAKEYSLSIAYSDKSFRPYQSRADAYMQYLKTILIPATKSSSANGEVFRDRSKALLCHAIHFDYAKAKDINNKHLEAINADLYLQIYNMKKGAKNYDSESKITPGHAKETRESLEMIRLRRLNQSKKNAIRNGVNIQAAIRDYELVCQTKSNPAR